MKNNLEVKPSVAGRYKIQAVNAKTGAVRELAPWFNNLITDYGLNSLGTSGVLSYCSVGSGSTPPVVSDTSLQGHVATTNSTLSVDSGTQASAPYFFWMRRVYRFSPGVATGNLSEIGIGRAVAGAQLFSRSLIKDGQGNPTTITVLADEYLDVTYEVRIYFPTNDVTFQANINGVQRNCVMRASNVTVNITQLLSRSFSDGIRFNAIDGFTYAYTGDIGTITQSPSGTTLGTSSNNSNTERAYSNNSLTKQGTIVFGLGSGNGDIRSINMQTGLGQFQCSFTPAITKNSTQVLTFEFAITWARKV